MSGSPAGPRVSCLTSALAPFHLGATGVDLLLDDKPFGSASFNIRVRPGPGASIGHHYGTRTARAGRRPRSDRSTESGPSIRKAPWSGA